MYRLKDVGFMGRKYDTLPETFTAHPSYKHILNITDSMDQLIYDGRPTVIDLFSGCGGFSLGMVNAGFRVVACVENDLWPMVTYCCNIPDYQEAPIHCYYKDIKKLSGREILLNAGTEDIDVVVGGPPCQSFSSAGKRKVGDERDNLVFEFQRLVKEIHPKTFVMENVPGIVSKKLPDGTKVIDKLIGGFK